MAATNAAIVSCGRAGQWSHSLALLSELQQAPEASVERMGACGSGFSCFGIGVLENI